MEKLNVIIKRCGEALAKAGPYLEKISFRRVSSRSPEGEEYTSVEISGFFVLFVVGAIVGIIWILH